MNKPLNIDPKFVNKSAIARNIGYSREYVRKLLNGERTNKQALAKVHSEIKKQLLAA